MVLNRLLLLLLSIFIFSYASAQQQDSLLRIIKDSTGQVSINDSLFRDSVSRTSDSLLLTDSVAKAKQDSLLHAAQKRAADSLAALKKQKEKEEAFLASKKIFYGQEMLFYSLLFLILFYAGMRIAFSKYFTDLRRVYFRTTLKQTQVKEQLLQTPLPSLLLNGFFIISGGMYAAFLVQHFNLAGQYSFWQQWLYAGILLSIIYMMKFTGVKLAGWLFNRNDAAASYTFIVFMTNKIIGIVVLPFLVLLAFGNEKIYPASLILSIVLVASLFMYRLYLTLGVVRSQLRVNAFQFLIYFTAFEVVPLLILFKLAVMFLK